MRLGIFGGSFDPVHNAHLILAEVCRQELALDRVLFVPAAKNPLKPGGAQAEDSSRLEMLQLAIGGNDAFEVCPWEIQREGISYTIETVTYLRQQHPDAELFFLMGADLVGQLDRWRQPKDIFAIATPVILNRGGAPAIGSTSLAAYVPHGDCDQVRCLSMPQLEISSSQLRDRIAAGKSIRYQTPACVEQYIANCQLYRWDNAPGDL